MSERFSNTHAKLQIGILLPGMGIILHLELVGIPRVGRSSVGISITVSISFETARRIGREKFALTKQDIGLLRPENGRFVEI